MKTALAGAKSIIIFNASSLDNSDDWLGSSELIFSNVFFELE